MQDTQLVAIISPRAGGPASLQRYPALVRRLSNAGISLGVSREVDDVLHAHADLEIELTLPDRDVACTIACTVRNRAAHDGDWLYGCEYDWSATMDPLGAVEDLLEYMLAR